MIAATQTILKAERAIGVEFEGLGAPSLGSAVRADAELLVKLCIENDLTESQGALCKHLRGATADVEGFGKVWYVHFFPINYRKVFAIVEVKI